MSETGKYLLLGAGTLLIVSLAVSGAKASHTASKLEVRLLPEKDRINWETVRVLLDVEVKNPTSGTLTLSNPVVRVVRDKKELKRIDLSGHRLVIHPESTRRISDPKERGGFGGRIVLEMPTAQIIAMFPDVAAALAGSGPPFRLDIGISMEVKAPHLPGFSRSETISLTLERPI